MLKKKKKNWQSRLDVPSFNNMYKRRHVVVESDHQPLQSLFRKPLQSAPQKLQRLLLCLQKYDLVIYKPLEINEFSRHSEQIISQ